MAKSTIDKKENIEEKLEYLGLDLENIPKQLKDFEPLKFRIPKTYEEKKYKVYICFVIDFNSIWNSVDNY